MVTVQIIGLGDVGGATFEDICTVDSFHSEILDDTTTIIGVDKDKNKLKKYSTEFENVMLTEQYSKGSDIYIISIYNENDIIDIVENIVSNGNSPLIVIESTITLDTLYDILELKNTNNFNVAIFPHRFNPGDDDHRVFNLDRIAGFDNDLSKKKFMDFYRCYMDDELIHEVPIEIAVLSKVVENTYRFMEIALAEELRMLCTKHDINFTKLRKAMNTKWNIDVKRALYGIGGKCLPKDTQLFIKMFPESDLIKQGIKNDAKYKKKFSK